MTRRHTLLGAVALAGLTLLLPAAVPAGAEDPTLKPVQVVPDVDSPFGTVLSPDGRHLYVLNAADTPTVSAFERGRGGRLTFLESEPVDAPGDTYLDVSPDGRNLYVSADGRVDVFDVARRTGRLTAAPTFTDDDAVLDDASGISVSGDGRFVYVSDVQGDAVNVLARNERGRLRLASVYGGTFSPDVVVAPTVLEQSVDGRQLYVTSCRAGVVTELTVLTRSPRTGRLKLKQSLDAGESCGSGVGAGRRSVVTADQRSGNVFGFRRNPETGILTRVDQLDFPDLGSSLQYIARPDGGRTAFVEVYGGGLARFTIDEEGELTPRGTVVLGTDVEPGVDGLRGSTADARNVYLSAFGSDDLVVLKRRR